MKLSIILPVYNMQPYLRNCLDSIIHQTYRDLEIIVVDDFSTDDSLMIAKEYASKDDRIIIIEQQENAGSGSARNSGMARATGEYIWFIDPDDAISNRESVSTIFHEIADNSYDTILFGHYIHKIDGSIKNSPITQLIDIHGSMRKISMEGRDEMRSFFQHILYNKNRLQSTIWMRWYRRAFLEEHQFQFIIKAYYQDMISLMLLSLADTILILPNSYYTYYHRSTSVMNSTYHHNLAKNVLDILKQYHQLHLAWPSKQHWSEQEYMLTMLTFITIIYKNNHNAAEWLSLKYKEKLSLVKRYHHLFNEMFSDKSLLSHTRLENSYFRGYIFPKDFLTDFSASFDPFFDDKKLVTLYHQLILLGVTGRSHRVKIYLRAKLPSKFYFSIKEVVHGFKRLTL